MITRSEYNDWKRLQTTVDLKEELVAGALAAKEELISRMTRDMDRDMFLRGIHYAYKEIFNWEPSEFAQEEPNEV